jgi:V8-like Glu-specific endopeptidase
MIRIKPVALPRPRRADVSAKSLLEAPVGNADLSLTAMLRRRSAAAYELGLIEAEIERFAIESQCGAKDDTQDVERYDGTLGVTRTFVETYEPPVGQLQWLDDLHVRFTGSGEAPGDVSGARWGSGALIAADLFLTAGHCFDQDGGGWQRPSRNGITIEPEEIATLMRVNFNYQVDGQTGNVRPGDPFPVTDLLEYRLSGVDYAIVRLGRNGDGKIPGDIYGALALASIDLTKKGAMICVIQHPNGRPKQIEAGPLLKNASGRITYDSIDTWGGSSGSPILSEAGEVVGVHTNGGCTAFSGANVGQAISAIRHASSIVN